MSVFSLQERKLKKLLLAKEQLLLAPKKPVIEVVDLAVDEQDIELKKEFEAITRIIPFSRFITQNTNHTLFGIDAALTNGIQLEYAGELLFDEPIKTNADFYKYGFDVATRPDGLSANANNVLTARWSFDKFVYPQERQGLYRALDKSYNLVIKVQDDLSGTSSDEIKFIVEGWKF